MADLLAGLRRDEPLAPRTSLGVGGPADWFFEAQNVEQLRAALEWARAQGLPVSMLGGGSNLLVSDDGFRGLVMTYAAQQVRQRVSGEEVLVQADAGLLWDDLVKHSVSEGLGGIECLSGIPGLVGASPIQNVGAYGQDVSQTVREVTWLDRRTGEVHRFGGAACDFRYRDSRFKRDLWGRAIVLEVVFALRPGAAGATLYPELRRRAEALGEAKPSLATVRNLVLELRRGKGMVLDPGEPNSRSAGSFFMNPELQPAEIRDLETALLGADIEPAALPRYPTESGRTKVPAAWLIEQAGFQRGAVHGGAGISELHSLALINRGEATAAEILDLASTIQAGVERCFGIRLRAEPRMLGFAPAEVARLLG